MKKIFLFFSCFLFLSTFILAQKYTGDGTYGSLSPGDIITADNGYSLNFVEFRYVAPAGPMTNAFYETFSPKGDKIGNFTLVDVNNPTTRFVVFNSLEGVPAINVTFTRSSPTSTLSVKVVSLTHSPKQEEQSTQQSGNEYTLYKGKPGFFKRSWIWFKCLFSRKC